MNLASLPACNHGRPVGQNRHGSAHFFGPSTYGHTEPCPSRIAAFCDANGFQFQGRTPRDWNEAVLAMGYPDNDGPEFAALYFAAYGSRLRALVLA